MGDKTDEIKGRAKEAWGDLTDDEHLEAEGKRDRMASDVKQKAENAVDSVRDKVNDALD